MFSTVPTSGPLSLVTITSLLSATPTISTLRALGQQSGQIENKITMWAGLGFALAIFTRKQRKVNGLERMKKKTWLVGFFPPMAVEKFKALWQKDHVDFLMVEIGSD